MHELSICEALLRQVEDIARQSSARGVRSISVQLGPLSGVDGAQLSRTFVIARAGTCAAAAELRIETLPVRLCCRECGAESEAASNRLLCSACGSWQTTLLSGDELLLRRVELMPAASARTAAGSLSETQAPCHV